MTVETKGQKLEELENLEGEEREKLIRRKEELRATTWLSPREAEIYILYTRSPDVQLKDVADTLGIDKGTVYKHWRNMKDKKSKSRATLDLNIP